jgi:iron complex transport system substrate-binding protein
LITGISKRSSWGPWIGALAVVLALTGTILAASADRPGVGSTVAVPPREAHRVVLFECYETVAALQAWERIVGLSRYAYDNDLLQRLLPQLRQIPSPGSGFDVNAEALLALKPDLVVTWTRKPECGEHLVRLGIPVMMFYPEGLADLYRDLGQLGQVLGREARARQVAGYMARSLAALQQRLAGVPEAARPRVVWLWGKPTTVNGNRGVMAEMLRLAGGRNVGAHLDSLNKEVSMETIIGWAPQVVAIWGSAAYSAQDLLCDPKWAVTPAVQNGCVFKAARVSTWSPRAVVLAWWLAHCFHPRLIAAADWRRAADDIYRQCYGIPYEEHQ